MATCGDFGRRKGSASDDRLSAGCNPMAGDSAPLANACAGGGNRRRARFSLHRPMAALAGVGAIDADRGRARLQRKPAMRYLLSLLLLGCSSIATAQDRLP